MAKFKIYHRDYNIQLTSLNNKRAIYVILAEKVARGRGDHRNYHKESHSTEASLVTIATTTNYHVTVGSLDLLKGFLLNHIKHKCTSITLSIDVPMYSIVGRGKLFSSKAVMDEFISGLNKSLIKFSTTGIYVLP